MTPAEHIAASLRKARGDAGISQSELARRCVVAGYPQLRQTAIDKIEHGERKLSAEELWIVSIILRVSPVSLLPSDNTKAEFLPCSHP